MAKKSVKRFEAPEEKSGFSIGPIIIAILAIALVGGVLWVFFSGSNASTSPFSVLELANDSHTKGNAQAKVTVIEFSDFQCPACGAAFPTVQQVFEKYKDRIRLVYRHFPLTTIHPFAVFAAEASECAAKQDKFWELHDALFLNQSVWTNASSLSNAKTEIRALAVQAGLDPSAFDSCLQSHEGLDQVQKDIDDGVRFGVNSTPTFFINTKQFSGTLSLEQFSREIDSALAQAN